MKIEEQLEMVRECIKAIDVAWTEHASAFAGDPSGSPLNARYDAAIEELEQLETALSKMVAEGSS